ncbi:MAG: hypothetical protein QGG36_24785 [Pirellulaceae bacterium]|jgi:hypothetical protein|nr:hypothetical protein [Pirellulaceae bacterium]MDP7019036.1 hypothetical protein [Pirellulaceae bacterium]
MKTSTVLRRNARAGITVIEVIFAIGIVTIGLLGVIALLPLAARQIQKGLTTDRAAMIGVSAVDQFDMAGLRRQTLWAQWRRLNGASAVFEYLPFVPIDASGAPNGDWRFASVCIDPRFMSVHQADLPVGAPQLIATPRGDVFPYYPHVYPNGAGGTPTLPFPTPRMSRVHLFDRGKLESAAAQFAPAPSPPRIGLQNKLMSQAHIAHWFQIDDDLSFLVPDDETLPPTPHMVFNMGPDNGWGVQGVDDDLNGLVDDLGEMGWAGSDDIPTRRQYKGEFSWMATLTPKLERTNRTRDEFILSIIVLRGRDPLMEMSVSSEDNPGNERVVNVSNLYSNGIGGGDVRLEAVDPTRPARDLQLRNGDWIMLQGFSNIRINAASAPCPVFRWYRVTAADTDPVLVNSNMPYNANNPVWARDVSLEGPDWTRPEWQGNNPASPPAAITQATIVTGVVAVYEKTIRLESTSLWSN